MVIAAPKIGLKHPKAVSSIDEFLSGKSFQPIYANKFGEGKDTQKIVFCSGKVYFDIAQKLENEGSNLNGNTVVVRVEELAPFPVK